MTKNIFSDTCTLPDGFDKLSETEKTIQFFKALGYKDNDTIYLRRFSDRDKSQRAEKMECQLYNFPSLRQSMSQFNQKDGFGVFFVVNGGGQKKSDVTTVRAQFMEMDDLTFSDQLRRIFSFPLEPSIIVKTRKSLHTYWIIDNGRIEHFRPIQKSLVAYFDSDEKIIDESRTMRVPYFYHMKQEPVMVEIVHFKPENVYTQRQLAELLPEVVEGNNAARKTIGKNEKFELPDVIPSGTREHTLFLYACSLQAKGYPDEEIAELVNEANASRCVEPLGEAEIQYNVLTALKFEKGNALKRFHKFNAKGQPYDINDDAILRHIVKNENLMVVEGKLYLYDHGVYSLDEDGILLRSKIKNLMFSEVVKNSRIKQALDLIMAEPSIQRSLDEVNQYPSHWINFKNGMFDVREMTMQEHKPEYYAINQIPHDFDPAYSVPDDSVVKRFIDMKFPDEEDREMFLQFCGYCMTTETNLQKFLILFGSGSTGKSTLLRLLSETIGTKNISSLPLQDLNQRFMATNLCGKLLNSCADIPSGNMEQVDVIKKCTGEDMLKGEYKGGKVFFFKSYAKLIFSANIIPSTYEDETGAFYRRLILIAVNEFGEFIPRLEPSLKEDIKSFISLCVQALHTALLNGFTESQNCKRHIDELRKSKDSVFGFLEDRTVNDPKAKIPRTDLYDAYESYCNENGWQEKTKHRFYENLVNKGYNVDVRVDGYRYVKGLTLKETRFHEADRSESVPFE